MTNTNEAPFGAWLKLRRKEVDLTQEELADRLGCSPWTITKIEAGERRPSKQLAELLCEQLRIGEADRQRFIALARSGKAIPAEGVGENEEQARREKRDTAASPPAHGVRDYGTLSGIPAPLTPIIGRESDIAAISRALTQTDTRLLTLVGPPGIGKTRLAAELALSLLSHFGDGVFVVPLAAISEASEVPGAIAHALRLPDPERYDAWENLGRAMHDRHALLVLDNFEQVVEAAPFVAELLRACPNLRALVTSREALRVRGEEQYELEPLTLPDLSHLPPLDELTSYSGVSLFVRLAASARSEFALQEENARDVAAICARLDGLPLAIELVAARIQLLPPWALLARLGSSLALLTGGPRDMPARHRTLRNAIGWSYDLLSAEEQALFVRLALFVGGADLEAIEAICRSEQAAGAARIRHEMESAPRSQDDLQPSDDVLSLLESLINKSLVRVMEQHPSLEPRYTMLQTIREYGLEKLKERKGGDEYEEAMSRFVAYYAGLVTRAEPYLIGPDAKKWLDRLERDYDNIRIALDWLLAHGDPLALKMCSPLWQLWEVRGYLNDGARWMERALAQVDSSDSPERARVLHLCSGLRIRKGDFEGARSYSLKSLEVYERLGDKKGIGSATQVLGIVEEALGNYDQAERYYNESVRLFRELGHRANLSRVLNSLGVLERMRGNYDRSVELLGESLKLQRELGSKRSIALILANLGAVAVARAGFPAETRAGFPAETRAGFPAETREEWEKAKQLFTESLTLRREIGHKVGVGDCLIGLGFVSIARGDIDKGVRLFAAGHSIYDLLDYRMEPSDFPQYKNYLDTVRSTLSDEEFGRAWAEGHSMGLEEAADYATRGEGHEVSVKAPPEASTRTMATGGSGRPEASSALSSEDSSASALFY